MPANRTIRPSIFPALKYQDGAVALKWLAQVFDLKEHVFYHGPDGAVAHAQMTLGDGMIMLGRPEPRSCATWRTPIAARASTRPGTWAGISGASAPTSHGRRGDLDREGGRLGADAEGVLCALAFCS